MLFRSNYMIDRSLQKTKSFTGIRGVNTQDVAVQEGMGRIVDRSREHLGSTDRAIVTMRRQMLEAVRAVEAGGKPRGTDPSGYAYVRGADTFAATEADIGPTIARETVAKF
mgnify:CR=1 FL=1